MKNLFIYIVLLIFLTCFSKKQYAQNTGMSKNPAKFINAFTIAAVLKEAGYRTLMTGKQHGEENP